MKFCIEINYFKAVLRLKILFLTIFLVACATADKNFNSSLENQRCESALEKIPEEQFGLKLASKTQKVVGTVFSYTATAGGYAAQIVLDTSKSTGFFLGCTLVALPFGEYVGREIANSCLKSAFKDYKTFTIGQDTYKKTSGFRCSNLNGLSDSILKVSDCYMSRNSKEGNQVALKYLKSIEQSDEFYNCLSENARNLVSSKIQHIEKM
ncbi:MAG: hypothetical protein A2622_04595 [Bdellovibrionales bacterium RIFCSPHIGHO2_01_FULL_40_29]|nr:MAG: hypothetical protein A2622_04595 [Bdellovibrionales bacterium RIFCSPHIGHO2_01_FULL_40_29]OFZ34787.1 MAG: hypothetical protein A3D17_10780 [Bdellovibrionales bacterium RIFCSPHIGHO2_02_FULL_40_15]